MTDEIKIKVDALTEAVGQLKVKAALTEQHVINHENLVKDYMIRSELRVTELDRKIETGFDALQADNAKQTDILKKWGTIRDTLVYVSVVVGGLVAAVWAVFTWVTGHLWPVAR